MRASWGVLPSWDRAAIGTWLGLLGCLAAIGCGTLPEVPSRGGPRWLNLTSEHFVLLTDAHERRAHQLSGDLERQLHALCQLGFSCSGELRVKLRVIALADRAQFEHVFDTNASAVVVQQLLFEPLIVLSEGNATDSLVAINRVLAISLAAQAMGPLPAWMFRGLGAYFESAHYDANGAFVVGQVPAHEAVWLHRMQRIPAAQLLDPEARVGNEEVITPSAWLLVHYLMSERGSDFAAFQAAIASGKSLSESFHEAFPDLSPERLDALLDRYAEAGTFLTFSRQLDAPKTEPEISVLTDSDVYELRAELFKSCNHCGDHAREIDDNLERALASDHGNVRASVLAAERTHGHDPAQLAQAEALTRAHPDAFLAYLHLAMLREAANAPDRCAPELMAKLESLAPYNAHALGLRAQCAQAAGQSTSALRLSRRALALAPNDQALSLAHAQLLYAQHACAELATLLERIRSAVTDAALSARLPQLEHCQAPEPADQAQKTPAREQ